MTVIVEDELAGSGENSADVPDGKPLTLRSTVSVNPPLGLIETV